MFHDHMRPQYSSTMDNIIRFKNQDFISLRNQCLRNGRLFEDDMFPANNSAIGQRLLKEKDIESPKWKRPKELLRTKFPHFILDGISKFDIRQGKAGDCWFLAALGSLTHKPKLLAKIIPTNQSFTAGYAGIFHFQFWQCGQWVDVVIDDRLPVESINRKYLFVHPRRGNNEFWPCLLEKAYAKLHGSYSQLHYGYTIDSLVELTGWVVTKINLKEVHPNLFRNLKVAEQSGSLITCGIADPSNMVEKFGLVNNHAYTVTGSAKISLDTCQEELIRLWNPWGEKEWTGRWSDNSREWQKVQESERIRLYNNKEDGEFWMSFLDFQKTFNSMLICFQYPMIMNDRSLRNGVWSILDKDQKIQRNIMQNSSSDALRNTVQYFFSVKEPMEGINVVISINIQPKQDRKKMPFFEVYKV
ncbi:calpain-13-like [Sminthopsis crassicaudata]|uniref:calpain-13-like n=1 Tax=Sminthopsis crassicaudata TaxID=9301 RepID=UPI003D69503C